MTAINSHIFATKHEPYALPDLKFQKTYFMANTFMLKTCQHWKAIDQKTMENK